MNGKFWDKFCNGVKYYFALKEDFDYAFTCVDSYWDTDTEESVRQRREEFIDNFEFGASFISISY